MSLGTRRFPLVLASFLSFVACADLPDIPRGVCGNGVLDAGEDCDGTVDGRSCGDVGSVGECRFACTPITTTTAGDTTTPTTTCPPSFGCGADGVCRQSAGTFTLSANEARAGVDVIALGDFGRQGVKSAYAQSVNAFGLGAPRIFAFDEKGVPLEPGSLPALLGPPQIFDVDGDGYADATTLASDGLTVLRGTSPTTLTAVAFDAYRPPPGASARIGLVTIGPVVTEGTLIATFPGGAPGGGPTTLLLARDTVKAPDPIAVLPVSVDQLGTHAASVIDPAGGPCGLPVYVAKKAKLVVVIQACDAAGEWAQPNGGPGAPRLLLQTRYPIVNGSWIVRFDDDEHDDLLLFTEDHWEVAFGDGKGGFFSRPPSDSKGVAGQTAVFRIELESFDDQDPSEEQKAVSELFRRDLSAPLDIASAPRFVALNQPPLNALVVAGRRSVGITSFANASKAPNEDADFVLSLVAPVVRTEAWTTARVGDVTGDGYLDVVGGSATNLDLDFVSGTETFLFNLSRIETGSPTRAMVLGDFDGDRVGDIAFAAAQTDVDDLVIAYGQAFSPPVTQVVVGSYPFIAQIEAANLKPAGTLATFDLTEDLGLVTSTKHDGTGEPTVAILRGSGNRLPLASLGLTKVIPRAGQMARPDAFEGTGVSLAVARGAGGGFHVDVLAKEPANATISDLRLWTLSGLTSSALVRAPAVIPGCRSELPLATSTAVDLDGNGADETAFLSLCEGGPSLIVVANAGTDATTATVVGPSPLLLPATPSAVIPVALVAGDVDGDGKPDLVATLSRVLGDGLEQGLAAIVERIAPVTVVLYNRGGVIDTANPVVLKPRGGDDVPVRAAAFLDIGGTRRLVIATPGELFVVGGQTELTYQPFPVASGARLDRVRSLAAGDVTGDGVEDLVIGQQPSSLRVLVGGAR